MHQIYSYELSNGLKWAIFSQVHIIIIFWWVLFFSLDMYVRKLFKMAYFQMDFLVH
jgi:hypothetical protein